MTDTHEQYTVLAANAGKHVLVEKPMARNVAEARRMVTAARDAGVSLAVAYRRRLFPQVVEALRQIKAGSIGTVVCVRTHYSGNMEIAQDAWRGDAEIGGALMEMARSFSACSPSTYSGGEWNLIMNAPVGEHNAGVPPARGPARFWRRG